MQARSEKNTRPSCYLCETPKMPWSVIDSLPNLPEGNVVCRSCVNFEGVDRIGDVIAETVRQKRDFQIQYPQNGRAPGTPQPSLSGRDRLKAMSRPGEGQSRVERPDDRNDSYGRRAPAAQIHERGRPMPPRGNPITHSRGNPNFPTTMPIGQPLGNTIGISPGIPINANPMVLPGHQIPLTTPRTIPSAGTGQIGRIDGGSVRARNPDPIQVRQHPSLPPTSQHVSPHMPTVQTSTPNQYKPEPIPSSVKNEPDNRRMQIEQTLQRLNENVPFRVRFKKEPSVRGRVYGFDCSQSRPSAELKVYIEYPIGSGKTYSSASAAAKQMSLDACGGSMDKMTPISSGFKFLEYEHKYKSDDWRLLGDFLTEGVRYFKEGVISDWIPTGYNDPHVAQPPKIPSGDANSDNSEEDIIVVPSPVGHAQINDRKRNTPPGGESVEPPMKRHEWQDKEVGRSRSPTGTPGRQSNTPETPNQPKPIASPRPPADGQTSPDTQNPQNGQPSLLCFLCKQRLEASHFVQCPSQQLHRFCFPCCQRTIRLALQESPQQEVFCPSGLRCAISGSQNPWAFMQAEIETILDRAVQINPNHNPARPTQG